MKIKAIRYEEWFITAKDEKVTYEELEEMMCKVLKEDGIKQGLSETDINNQISIFKALPRKRKFNLKNGK